MTSRDLPRVYTLREVQEIAQVSRRTLYLWIEDGYLEAVKVGGRWRVPQAELDALISGAKGSYKRREYAAGKPVGYTAEARARPGAKGLQNVGKGKKKPASGAERKEGNHVS